MSETSVAIRHERQDSAGFYHTYLERPPRFAYSPGQYLAVRASGEDKVRYLAIASHPDEADLYLLSRHQFAGQNISISPPQGPGFACDFSAPAPMLLITHGTGISAMRPALLERRRLGHVTDTLLYGAVDEAHEPDTEIVTNAFPVRQVRAYSRSGNHQRVQQVLPAIDCASFGSVLLVGGKEMMADIREILSGKQFPAAQIYSNF